MDQILLINPKKGCNDKMQRYTTWFDKDLPSLSKTKWAESKRVGKMLFVSSQVVKIKSLVHITMSSLSPADGIWCIQLKAVQCRSIDEWVLRYLAPIGLRSASKSNTPIVWGFQQVPSQNMSFNYQSSCECITLSVGLVSLGSLSKMPVWTLSGPGPNV